MKHRDPSHFDMSHACPLDFLTPVFFFFNDTAPTEIYTLSLHDALPIFPAGAGSGPASGRDPAAGARGPRSEEHTSELQSRLHLVCRLLLEKKKKRLPLKSIVC